MKRMVAFALAALTIAACQDSSGPAGNLVRSAPAPVFSRDGGIPDRYIVVLNDAAGAQDQGDVEQQVGANGGELTHSYRYALKGFAARLPAAALARLSQDPRVKYIEQDQTAHAIATQTSATWGIDRIDQRALPLTGTYTYNATGNGVTVYIIDTGIRFDHAEFGVPTRASKGVDEVTLNGSAADCNGHGTHVSGTIGGSTYGVAKNVKLVAVRVLDCSGSGSYSGVVAGVDWVTGQKNANVATPMAANMSLGGPTSQALDDAIARSTAAGVVHVVAAGNDGLNACNYSPARAASAITVGATDNTDTRTSWSNTGTCVDIFAPGLNITSSWYTTATATNTISGTSMASPHVAGAAALYLEGHKTATVAEVTSALTSNATPNVVKSPGTGSPNRLLYTGFISSATTPVISLSPSSFSFAANVGGPAPSQNLTITNSGIGTLNWTASVSSGAAWLTIAPASGSTTTSSAATVSVNTTGLAAGAYSATITVSDAGATPTTQNATVTLTITAPPPAPTAPTAGTPANNATGVAVPATLSWSGATGATSYRVQVSAGTSVAAPYAYDQTVTGTSTTVSGLSAGTQYSWQVTAINSTGSAPSPVWTFTTAAAPTTTVTVTPASASIAVNGTVTLTATTNPVGRAVTWSSNNIAVATVSSTGVVTGKAAGSATITAIAADGGKGTSTVTVTAATPCSNGNCQN